MSEGRDIPRWGTVGYRRIEVAFASWLQHRGLDV